MKIYETIIPETWPFKFAIVGSKLINVEERPIYKTESWWSKEKGHHYRYNYIMIDGVRNIVHSDRCVLFPTFNVPKTDYETFIFDTELQGLIEYADREAKALEISIEQININIVKKDWIDHWEVGMVARKETLQHGTLLTDIEDYFR